MTDLFGQAATREEVGDSEARLLLHERWSDGPFLGFLGMNPSLAGADRNDSTFLRGRAFARAWGFGGQIWGNPCPFRSPKPTDAIRRLRDLGASDLQRLADNTDVLGAAGLLAKVWLLGWGEGGAAMERVRPDLIQNALAALERTAGPRTYLAFGLTASGAPTHILARGKARIPNDARPHLFDTRTWKLGDVVNDPRRLA